MKTHLNASQRRRFSHARKGVILVLGAITITAMLFLAAFAVDLGLIVLTKAELQNAADAATLAAALELASNEDDATIVANARAMAMKVANMNRAAGRPVFLNAGDIELGIRSFNTTTREYEVTFGAASGPYNAVRVTARRDSDNPDAPDGELELFFAKLIGHDTAKIAASSQGVISPRDLVFVLDVSGSMGDDTNYYWLPEDHNMAQVYDDLFGDMTNPNPRESDRPTPGSGGYPGVLWEAPTNLASRYEDLWDEAYDKLDDNPNLSERDKFPLNKFFPDGWRGDDWETYADWVMDRNNPHLTIGRGWARDRYTRYRDVPNSDKPNRVLNDGRVGPKINDATRIRNFGKQTYVNYLLYNGLMPFRGGTDGSPPTRYELYDGRSQGDTPAIVDEGTGPIVRVQPIHAVREGAKVGVSAVEEGNGGTGGPNDYDQIALTTFATRGSRVARGQTGSVHLRHQLSSDYESVRETANKLWPLNYGGTGMTNVGEGIEDGIWVLNEGANARNFSAKVLAILSDGQSNQGSYRYFDGIPDGSWNPSQRWALYQASRAKENRIRVHTISLGANADLRLMDAIAELTGGNHYNIQFSTPEERQQKLNAAFEEIGKDRLGQLFRFTPTPVPPK